MKAVGCYHFVLLSLVVMNLPHGPYREQGMRFQQMQESLRDMLDNFNWRTFALFRARVDTIIEEFGDVLDISGSENPHQVLWTHLQSLEAYPKSGRKTKSESSWLGREAAKHSCRSGP